MVEIWLLKRVTWDWWKCCAKISEDGQFSLGTCHSGSSSYLINQILWKIMRLRTEEFGIKLQTFHWMPQVTTHHYVGHLPDVSGNVMAMPLIFSSRSNDNCFRAAFQNVFSLQFKTLLRTFHKFCDELPLTHNRHFIAQGICHYLGIAKILCPLLATW